MVNNHPSLSEGFFERVFKHDSAKDEKPILQIMGTKPLNQGDRFRLLVSDGRHVNAWVMLATQLNDLVKSGQIQRCAIIRVNKHICNAMQSAKGDSGGAQRRILILLEVEMIKSSEEQRDVIGNPVQMNQDGTFPANSTPTPAAAVNGNHAAGFKRPPSPAPMAEQPKPKAAAPVRKQSSSLPPDISPEGVVPISMLTPYSNTWVLRARVTQKSDVRTWSNSKGEGKLFSMTLADESGEIRMTFFNEAVDRCYDIVTNENVYFVKGGRLKPADKRYSSVKNEYEITADLNTQVFPCEDDAPNIPKTCFDFVKIKDIMDIPPQSQIDIIAVVKSGSEATTFTAKSSQKEFTKRELILVDDSKKEIGLTLWGETAVKFDPTDQPIVAIKGVKVSDYGGRSLSTGQSSTILVNPSDLREAHILRGWFDDGGKDEHVEALTVRGGAGAGGGSSEVTSVAIAKNPLKSQDETKYYSVLGTIVSFREGNCVYKSCGIDDCKKKVVDQQDGTYMCPKCCRPNVTTFVYRYTLSGNVRDATDGTWVVFFEEQAKELLGMDAQELGTMLNSDDNPKTREVFGEALFKQYNFKLRCKMENYNDDSRLKATCIGVSKVSTAEQIEIMEKEMARLCRAVGVNENEL